MNRDILARLAALEAKLADVEVKGSHGATPSNIASVTNQVGNAAGYGNTNPASIIAVCALPSLYTGIFKFTASARAATAAADVSTWALTTQTQAAAFAFTNAQVLTSGGGGLSGTGSGFLATPGIAPPVAAVAGAPLLAALAVASAAAGAGIGITGGPFGEVAQWSRAITMAGTGDAFSVSGYLFNANSTTIIGDPAQSNFYRGNRSFALGNAVALVLKYTNSVADRAITAITMSLEEVRF